MDEMTLYSAKMTPLVSEVSPVSNWLQ